MNIYIRAFLMLLESYPLLSIATATDQKTAVNEGDIISPQVACTQSKIFWSCGYVESPHRSAERQ